jgi:hypothetical protein
LWWHVLVKVVQGQLAGEPFLHCGIFSSSYNRMKNLLQGKA